MSELAVNQSTYRSRCRKICKLWERSFPSYSRGTDAMMRAESVMLTHVRRFRLWVNDASLGQDNFGASNAAQSARHHLDDVIAQLTAIRSELS